MDDPAESLLLVGSQPTLLETPLRQQGKVVERVGSLEELQQRLRAPEPPHIVLTDLDLEPALALEACAAADELGDNKPFVLLLTSNVAEETIAFALANGADDYLEQPFQLRDLRLRLMLGTRLRELRQRVTSTRKHLHYFATHDALTGTWNKSAILGCLYRETARAVRQGRDLAVLMCDIDHFKAINDRFGHLAGDEVLRSVAACIQGVTRLYDEVGRYGGEEFLVLLPGCDSAQAREIAERIVRDVGERAFDLVGTRVRLTVSVGVAALTDFLARGIDPPRPSVVLELADEALYRAKAAGRDRVVLASSQP